MLYFYFAIFALNVFTTYFPKKKKITNWFWRKRNKANTVSLSAFLLVFWWKRSLSVYSNR